MGRVSLVGSYIVALVIDTDRLPTNGETLIGRNYHRTHGGKRSNMACCAARLGADAIFIGKVGQDDYARSGSAAHRRGRVERGSGVHVNVSDRRCNSS